MYKTASKNLQGYLKYAYAASQSADQPGTNIKQTKADLAAMNAKCKAAHGPTYFNANSYQKVGKGDA